MASAGLPLKIARPSSTSSLSLEIADQGLRQISDHFKDDLFNRQITTLEAEDSTVGLATRLKSLVNCNIATS